MRRTTSATILMISCVAFAAASLAAEAPLLIQILTDRPHTDFVCPCEFDLGTKVDGELGLIIDRNGTGQRAFANIEGLLLELENSQPFVSSCDEGELVAASWRAGEVEVEIQLLTEDEGEEACWYRGLMTVIKRDRGATRKIVGACGC